MEDDLKNQINHDCLSHNWIINLLFVISCLYSTDCTVFIICYLLSSSRPGMFAHTLGQKIQKERILYLLNSIQERYGGGGQRLGMTFSELDGLAFLLH